MNNTTPGKAGRRLTGAFLLTTALLVGNGVPAPAVAKRSGPVKEKPAGAHALEETLTGTLRYSRKYNGGTVKVMIKGVETKPAAHKIKAAGEGVGIDGCIDLVNGRFPYGLECAGGDMISRISEISVSWNGAEVKVPESILGRLFNLPVVPSRLLFRGYGVSISPSSDGESVMIRFITSNASEDYDVSLVVTPQGSSWLFPAEPQDFKRSQAEFYKKN